MKTLVVPGEVVDGLLLTAVPVPTEGQPEWWRCERCGARLRADTLPEWWTPDTPHNCKRGADVVACALDGGGKAVPDGPFPFPVAVWGKVCSACGLRDGDRHDRPVGAVVATVEVTGEGHHADECEHDGAWLNGEICQTDYCTPDALPDCWHTPVRVVRDVTIPMERPCPDGGVCGDGCRVYPHRDGDVAGPPASSWWAEVDA